MTNSSKRYILNLVEGKLPESLCVIFEELGVALSDKEESVDCEFTLIDTFDPEVSHKGKLVLIGTTESRELFFQRNGVAIVSEELLSRGVERTFLKRVLGENSTLQVSSSFEGQLESLGKVKVTDHLNSGFYCDSIAMKSGEAGFEFFKVKKGIFHLLNYVSEVVYEDKGSFPLDIDFGVCDDSFFLQAHFPVEGFYKELVDKSFSSNGSLNSVLDEVTSLDIYTLERTGKLVISLVWNRAVDSHKSIYMHGIEKFEAIEYTPKGSLPKITNISHNGDSKLDIESKKRMPLSILRRVIKFLEQSEHDPQDVTISSIDTLLRDYPNQKLVSMLGAVDKEEIVTIIRDSSRRSEIENSLDEMRNSVDQESLLERFLNKVSSLDIDEANEIVSIGVQDYSDAVERVSGWIDEEDDSTIIVKGSREDIGEEGQLVKGGKEEDSEHSQVVSGEREDLGEGHQIISGANVEEDRSSITIKGNHEDLGVDREVMEVKNLNVDESDFTKVKGDLPRWRSAKDSLIDEVRKKILNKEIDGHDDLSDQVSELLQSKIKISKEESAALVDGLLNESVLESMAQNDSESGVDSSESDELREASAKKDIQLSRMMKVIEMMKKELLATKERVSTFDSSKLELDIKNLNSEIEKKNKQIEFLKKNTENLSTNMEVEKSKSDSLEMLEVEKLDSAEVKSYESKIKSLEAMLEEARSRSEVLNSKLEEERKETLTKSDTDTTHFREKMMKSQMIINKIQKENRELGAEVEKLQKARAELSNVTPSSVPGREENLALEKNIESLTLEVKKEKDQCKAIGLKVKQLEQKNKFLTAQVEESRKKTSSSRSTSKAPDTAKLQYKVKQLEKLNSSFKAESDKSKLELAEKKKELHKVKLEANLLKSKVTELERKDTINKKKAA